MPQIGEIKRGLDIGSKPKWNKYIWRACIGCGKERWVELRKGQPNRLRCNSCSRRSRVDYKGCRIKSKQKYIYIRLQPDDFFYSMIKRNGYVLEHRLIMAKHLGRCLQRWEVVHHKNHIRDDNRIENLQLHTESYHQQITILENRIKVLEKRVTLLEAENILLKEENNVTN